MEVLRGRICFDEPDEAYLTAAALRRYRDGSVDAFLIPSERGPALDIARDAMKDPFVRSIVRRFGGKLEDHPVAGA